MISTMLSGTIGPSRENPEERPLSARRCAQEHSSGWVAVDPDTFNCASPVARRRGWVRDEWCCRTSLHRSETQSRRPEATAAAGQAGRPAITCLGWAGTGLGRGKGAMTGRTAMFEAGDIPEWRGHDVVDSGATRSGRWSRSMWTPTPTSPRSPPPRSPSRRSVACLRATHRSDRGSGIP